MPQVSEFDSDIFNRLIAVFRIFCQASPNDSLKMVGSAGTRIGNWRRLLANYLVERINRIFAVERLLSGYGLVQDAAERENVRAMVDLFGFALRLFRRHVVGGAEHRAGGCMLSQNCGGDFTC